MEGLHAPAFQRNQSTEKIRQRAVEKGRNREARRAKAPNPVLFNTHAVHIQRRSTVCDTAPAASISQTAYLRFPSLFSNDFGPSALLYPTPTVTKPLSYAEGVAFNSGSDGFSIVRPTIELPLDELLTYVDMADSTGTWSSSVGANSTEPHYADLYNSTFHCKKEDNEMKNLEPLTSRPSYLSNESHNARSALSLNIPPPSQLVKDMLPQTVAPSSTIGRDTPWPSKPALSVRTSATPVPGSSGLSATATIMNPAGLQANYNTAPGGGKAECSNCGDTHTIRTLYAHSTVALRLVVMLAAAYIVNWYVQNVLERPNGAHEDLFHSINILAQRLR